MPEINHKTSTQVSAPADNIPEVVPTLKEQTPTVAAPSPPAKEETAEAATKKLAQELAAAGVTEEALNKQIELIMKKRARERAEAMKPREPDWSSITEQEAYNPAVYIPIIEHDIPDYMNLKLKDQEYEAVWASKDQRRLGQLLAEGYEYLKEEHVHPHFKVPLKFSSDGLYIYQDVIALRVHKRILYSKRRRALEMSINQLKRKGADSRIKSKLNSLIEADPFLENAMNSGGMGFYETDK